MLTFTDARVLRDQRRRAYRQLRPALSCPRLVTLFAQITLLAVTQPGAIGLMERLAARLEKPAAARAGLGRVETRAREMR